MSYQHTNSKKNSYFLHSKFVQLKSGAMRRIFYFAKAVTPEFVLADVPEGYEVFESKTGLPMLRKRKAVVLA